MTIAIMGDSHTVALYEAWAAMSAEERASLAGDRTVTITMLAFGAKFLGPFHRLEEDHLQFTVEEMLQAHAKAAPREGGIIRRGDGRTYIVSLGFHGVALYNYPMWQNFTVSKSKQEKQYLSRAALRAMVFDLNKHILSFYDALQSLGLDYRAMLPPPLPRTYLEAKNHISFDDAEIIDLRAGYTDAFATLMKERGHEFIAPPEGITRDGWLLPHLGQTRMVGDHHGNPTYGALMLRKVLPDAIRCR